MAKTIRHFLDIRDFQPEILRAILNDARIEKQRRLSGGRMDPECPLKGKVIGLLFELPSTRTRLSFDVGVRELGGDAISLTSGDMQLGRGESVGDTAQVLSRYLDLLMVRTLDPNTLKTFADEADIPIINGLTRASHPCQILADIMTVEENHGAIEGQTLAWIGDCNNVFLSLAEAAGLFRFTLNVAAPETMQPSKYQEAIIQSLQADIRLVETPLEAVRDAHTVITDCWVSMGDTGDKHNEATAYQVNSGLMAKAPQEAIFMHCLPAHRGEEVTDEVMDGKQSRVFDEVENRLHVQKSIMKYCLFGEASLKSLL